LGICYTIERSNLLTLCENLLNAYISVSPLLVSGIVTYEITDSRRAAIDVPDAHNYVMTQAPAVLKRVISQFPYDSETSDVACLRKEPQVVSALMMETLQDRVRVAGVRIESFAINELSYAPEIAHSMLKRQQAGALIEARQVCLLSIYLLTWIVLILRFTCIRDMLPSSDCNDVHNLAFRPIFFLVLIAGTQRIVQGATDIAKNAARDEELASVMTPDDRSRLVANLLVVLVSDKDATPVIEV
jgi:SPFH domain / Band 7 family